MGMVSIRAFVAAGTMLCAFMTAASSAQEHRAEEFARLKELARRKGMVPVIVQLNVPDVKSLTAESMRATKTSRAAQADARLAGAIDTVTRRELAKLSTVAHRVHRTYSSIPFVALGASEAALQILEASPDVVDINEDYLARPMLDNTVNIVGASASWTAGYDGTGWHVAILDTGIRNTHEFFAGKDIVEACFARGSDGDLDDGDCPNGQATDFGPGSAQHHATPPNSGHGTHVAGIAAGNGPGVPAAGVAKGADIIAIQVFSQFFGACDGADCVLSWSSDQIAALDYLYFSLRNFYDIPSANMSIGGGEYTSQGSCDSANAGTKAAIDNLRGVGIATVIAAGNDGFCGAMSGPGCISTAVGVGATTDADVEASFSNFHATMLDIYAPGVDVLSSWSGSDTQYISTGGTSMATPHVAGAWAILKQAVPTAGVQTILDALDATGAPVSGRVSCEPTPAQRRIQIDAAIDLLLPLQPCDVEKLTASDANDSHEYGKSVWIDGDAAVAGARLDDDQGADAGSVYVYRRTGTSWGGEVELFASDAAAGDQFGSAVAVEGDVLIVGASEDEHGGLSGAGSAYVFRFNGSSWVQEQKLTASDAEVDDAFGWAVAISGDVIAVSAFAEDTGATDAGAVYVFRYDGSSWVEEQKLTAFDAANFDNFGFSVSVSGDVVVSSSPNDDDAGSGSGSVYVYRFNGSSWNLDAKLTASDAAGGDRFGRSVSVVGDDIMVGAYRDDDGAVDAGSVYHFEWTGSLWAEREEILALDPVAGDGFGQSVSLSAGGDRLVVGAYQDDDAGSNAGSVYVFRRGISSWIQEAELTASDAAANDSFGYSVSMGGGYAIIGAYLDDHGVSSNAGSAYVMAVSGDCNSNHLADACDIINDPLLDQNGNGEIDTCECPPSSPPQPELLALPGDPESKKNRFLSIKAGDAGQQQAIRVTFVDLPGSFAAWNGMTFFVGQPHQVCENSGQDATVAITACGSAPGIPQNWSWFAPLVCGKENAHYMDWTTLSDHCVGGGNNGAACVDGGDCPGGVCGSDGVVHLYHEGIVPGGTYEVQVVTQGCSLQEDASYSDPLQLIQSGWGDVVEDCTGCPCGPPDGGVAVTDLVALVDKFVNLSCAVLKSRVDLEPGDTNFVIDISDLTLITDSFTGSSYPFSPGDPCN